MKLIIPLLLFFSTSAIAQDITASPICFTVRNEAPYRVYGDISTNYDTNAQGQKIRHNGSFRLEKAGTTQAKENYYLDRSEFCSKGPFYQGRQLELTIRTLIPVFSCKTSIELGEIIIKGKINDDGTTKTWAVCY